MKIKKMMYELYKIDWMEHHVSLSRQKESVKEYFCGETSFDSYEDYLFERGFQGEMYASLEEFLNNEYLDENIIGALLDVDSKSSFNEEILAEYQKDLAYSKIVHVESSIKNLEDLVKGCDFAVPICDNLVGKESYDFSRMIPKVLYDTDGIFYNKDTGALYYVSESEITEVEVVKVVDADDYAEEFSKPVPNHYFCGEADDCSCFAYFAKKEKKGDLCIVKEDEKVEFIGQIIDIFEDFLEDNGIEIPNSEREDENNSAIIYGSDYGRLQEDLEKCMKAWGVIEYIV